MRKFYALVKLNLKAMLSSFRFSGGKKKRRAASGLGALIFMAVLALYLSGTYSFMFAAQLAPIGMLKLEILMMSVLAVVMGLVFTLFAAQGVIFGGRDNDLMLAMPVSAFSLMLARTLALYVENLVFTLFIMMPAGVAYLVFGGGGGAVFLIVLTLCTLFLALVPTFFSLIFGFVLAWASGKLGGRSKLLSNLLYLAAFAVFMVLLMRMNLAMGDLASYAMGIEGAFSGWGLPFLLLAQAACEGSILSLLGFVAFCVAPFLLVVWLFAGRYKKIVTSLGARSARSDYRLGRVSASGARRALLKKEAGKFFGTPIYLFNSGMGLILLLGAAAAALVFKSKLGGLLAELEAAGSGLPVLPLAALAVCFLLSTVMITAPSISLEGKQLWILKEAPISARGVFLVKVGFQLLLELPSLLLSTICLAFALGLSAVDWLLLFALGAALSVCTALLGLFANLCMPKLDAPNDTVVVKQSASVMVAMLGGMGLVLAGAVLFVLTRGLLGPTLALLPGLVLFLAGCAVLWRLLATRGEQMFLEL